MYVEFSVQNDQGMIYVTILTRMVFWVGGMWETSPFSILQETREIYQTDTSFCEYPVSEIIFLSKVVLKLSLSNHFGEEDKVLQCCYQRDLCLYITFPYRLIIFDCTSIINQIMKIRPIPLLCSKGAAAIHNTSPKHNIAFNNIITLSHLWTMQ